MTSPSPSPTPPPASLPNAPTVVTQNPSPNASESSQLTPRPSSLPNQTIHFPTHNPNFHTPRRSASPALGPNPERPSSSFSYPIPARFTSSAPEPSTLEYHLGHTARQSSPNRLVLHQEYDEHGEHIIHEEIHYPHEVVTHHEIYAPDEHVLHHEIHSPREHITHHQLMTPHERITHDNRYIPRGGLTYHEHIVRHEHLGQPLEHEHQGHILLNRYPNGNLETNEDDDNDYVNDFLQLHVLSNPPESPIERFHLPVNQNIDGNYNDESDQDIDMNVGDQEHQEQEMLASTSASEHEITPQPRYEPLPPTHERVDRSSPDAPQTPSSGYYSPPIHEHQQSSSPTFQLDTTRAIIGGSSPPPSSDYGHSRSQSLTYPDMYPESTSSLPRPFALTPGDRPHDPEDQEEQENPPMRLRGGGQEISFFREEYDKVFPSYSYTESNQPSRNVPVDLLPDDPPLILPNFAQKRAEFLAAQAAAAAADQQATGGSNTSSDDTIVPNKPAVNNEAEPRNGSAQDPFPDAGPSFNTTDVNSPGIQGQIVSDATREHSSTERTHTFFGGRTVPILEYRPTKTSSQARLPQHSRDIQILDNTESVKKQGHEVKWYQKAINAAKASGRRLLHLFGRKNDSATSDDLDPSTLFEDRHRRNASDTERSNLSASPAEKQQLYTHTRVRTPPLPSVAPTSSPSSTEDHTGVTPTGNTSEGYHLGNELDHRTRNASPPISPMITQEQYHPSLFSPMTDPGPRTPPDPFASGDESADDSHRGRKMTPKIRFGSPDSPTSPMETQAYRPEPLTRRSEQIPREPYIPDPALQKAKSASNINEARISDPDLQAIQDKHTGSKRSAVYQKVKKLLTFNRSIEASSSSMSQSPPTPELGSSSSSDHTRGRRNFWCPFRRPRDNDVPPGAQYGGVAMSRTSGRGPQASVGSADRRLINTYCPCLSNGSDKARDEAEQPLLPQPLQEAESTHDQGKGKGKEVTKTSGDDTEGGGSGSQEHEAENVAGPSGSVGESGGDDSAGSGSGSGREQRQDTGGEIEGASEQGASEETRLLASQPHLISNGMSIPPNIDRFAFDEEDQYPPPNPDMSWVPAPDPSFGPNFSNIYRDPAIANRPFGGIEVGIRPRQSSSEVSNDPPPNRSLRPPPRVRPSSSSSVRPGSTLLPREIENPPPRDEAAVSPPDIGSSTQTEVEGFHVPPPIASTQMVKTDSGASGKTFGKGAQTPGTGHSSQIPPVPDITVRTHDLPTGEDDIDDSPHESLLPPRVLTDPSRNASSTSLPASVRSSGKSSYRRHSPLRHAADIDPNYNDLLNVENVSRSISQSPSPKPSSEEESQSVTERRRRLKGKWKEDEEAGISMERGIAIPSWSGTPDEGTISAQELDNPPSSAPSSQQPAVQLPPSLQSVFVPPTPPVQPSPAQTNVSEASSYAIYTRNPEGAYSMINGQSLKEDRSTALESSKRTSLGEAAITMTKESGTRGHPRSGSFIEASGSLEPPVAEAQGPSVELESLPPLPTTEGKPFDNREELTNEIDDPTRYPPQRIGSLNPTSQTSTLPEQPPQAETTKTVDPPTEYSSFNFTESPAELDLPPGTQDSGTSEQEVEGEDTSGAYDGNIDETQPSSAVKRGNQPAPLQPAVNDPTDDQPSQPIQPVYPPPPIAGSSAGNPATPFQPTKRSRVKRVWHKIKKTLKKL